ncbi:DUF6596 domain-containing protein [Streptomyces sp. SDr-06]|uniref:DUF6596 domain-containing protein n=1 Tax=Streptomyces sp. SDr-06 TaxID=2267702 RepID=UPI0011C05BDD|nr:DUF6596 domain-containing protein [Streptomyces sp. SDr-06]
MPVEVFQEPDGVVSGGKDPGLGFGGVLAQADRAAVTESPIRSARIPFRVPGPDELPARLPSVLRVIYLVFTEGYAASSGNHLVRPDLAEEAIRLARIPHRLYPGEREATGLLALLLLTDARQAARVDAGGGQILLEVQDRAVWDAYLIAEGHRLLVPALSGPGAGRPQCRRPSRRCTTRRAASRRPNEPEPATLARTTCGTQQPLTRLTDTGSGWPVNRPTGWCEQVGDLGDRRVSAPT